MSPSYFSRVWLGIAIGQRMSKLTARTSPIAFVRNTTITGDAEGASVLHTISNKKDLSCVDIGTTEKFNPIKCRTREDKTSNTQNVVSVEKTSLPSTSAVRAVVARPYAAEGLTD